MEEPPIYVGRLGWADVDPKAHPLDRRVLGEIVEGAVREAAASSVERGAVPSPDALTAPSVVEEHNRLAAELDRRLTARFGAWANGFLWGVGEPGGGGLVTAWCCPSHSLGLASEGAVSASVATVTAAVVECRGLLEELDRRYAALDTVHPALGPVDAAVRAAPELAAFVVARNDASDAWYTTFATVLRWYLERRGYEAPGVAQAISETTRGVFSSWCAPSATAIESLGVRLPRALERPATADALASWIGIRRTAFGTVPARSRTPVTRDGHLAYLATYDRRRGAARAERMEEALVQVRRAALAREPLDLAALRRWTGIALGEPAELRTTDAFAKGGRERYAFRPGLADEVLAVLAEASGPPKRAIVSAARVYLDVCFFHPFEDGNARAARLALDWVLTSADLALHAAEPVFALARAADDAHGAWWLAHVLDHLAGERG